MRKQWYAGATAALLALATVACTSDITPPVGLVRLNGLATLIITEEEVLIHEKDFDEADADKNGSICVKETPSGDLVLKEASDNTLSQPCPPPFVFKGKGETIRIQKEWFLEDANRNSIICVKETGGGRFIVKDDNEATPSQACPPAFYATEGNVAPHKVPFDLLALGDENANHLVCLLIPDGSRNFIVKDDNEATPSQPCPPSYFVEPVGKMEGPLPEPPK